MDLERGGRTGHHGLQVACVKDCQKTTTPLIFGDLGHWKASEGDPAPRLAICTITKCIAQSMTGEWATAQKSNDHVEIWSGRFMADSRGVLVIYFYQLPWPIYSGQVVIVFLTGQKNKHKYGDYRQNFLHTKQWAKIIKFIKLTPKWATTLHMNFLRERNPVNKKNPR